MIDCRVGICDECCVDLVSAEEDQAVRVVADLLTCRNASRQSHVRCRFEANMLTMVIAPRLGEPGEEKG